MRGITMDLTSTADVHASTHGKNRVSLRKLARVSLIATGVQFGWALQLSLLTPYIEQLGIPHAWASYIWLCGPISGMVMQPLVGHLSDQCRSPWGRRRPFIVSGAFLVVIAVLIIGFSADVGYAFGDSLTSRPRAVAVFVVGFWILDLANNTLQGPCRALLADFTGEDNRRSRRANAFFSLYMAIGNILGYATGAYSGWYKIFSFTLTTACNKSCANLKSAFLIGIVLLLVTTCISMTAVSEIPWSPMTGKKGCGVIDATIPLLVQRKLTVDGEAKHTTLHVWDIQEECVVPISGTFLWELLQTLRDLPKPMRHVLIVSALTWFSWYPFILFDTDWMGREVYLGEPSTSDGLLTKLYSRGVRVGSFGLMLNSFVLGVTSLFIEPLCRRIGPRNVWGTANIILSVCFIGTSIITILSPRVSRSETGYPPAALIWAAIGVFSILGIPLAVAFSIPYAVTSAITNTTSGGQGLSMGVLNIAIVIPQIVVSVGSGPWDELFGGGNMPAFVMAAAAAFIAGMLAILLLPKTLPDRHSSSIAYKPFH